MKLLYAADVAELLGWPTRRARRWLLRTGAGRMVGGRVVATPGRLLRSFPEAYEALASAPAADDPAECASCDDLRTRLADMNRQVDELSRRLGERHGKPGRAR